MKLAIDVRYELAITNKDKIVKKLLTNVQIKYEFVFEYFYRKSSKKKTSLLENQENHTNNIRVI
jgi:hypothetical protein